MFIIYRLAPHFTMALKQKLLYLFSLNLVEFSEHMNDDALALSWYSHYIPFLSRFTSDIEEEIHSI